MPRDKRNKRAARRSAIETSRFHTGGSFD